MDRKRIACVTGGTSGIGRGITEQFLKEDYIVYAIGRGSQHAEELKTANRNDALHVLIGDICDVIFQKEIFSEIEKTHGLLDVLVNSAGKLVLSESGGGILETLDAWRETFDINLFSLIGMTQSLYPLLKKGSLASVINISSVCSLYPFDTCSSNAYSASKAGVDLLTKRLAQQLAPEGIRVNAINPGVVHSNIMASAKLSVEQQQAFKDRILEKRHPLGRLGHPKDVAHAASYLASEQAEWVTGTLLSVDGGYGVS
ncbi:MAG: SDR family NAD(P)-dependent oxidoreductase [Alphaproteobacteria bacterium]|nr:SDR family NAD(P)-dependent oxidoreductase [Alphaproteobacteria bacterium]